MNGVILLSIPVDFCVEMWERHRIWLPGLPRECIKEPPRNMVPICGGAEWTDYLEAAMVDEAFRNVAFAPVITVYAALYTAAPGETGGGTEIGASVGYARQAAAFGAGSQVAGAYKATNSSDITFGPDTTTNWGTITHTAILDASTAGNMYGFTPLDTSRAVVVGDSAKFLAGNLGTQAA